MSKIYDSVADIGVYQADLLPAEIFVAGHSVHCGRETVSVLLKDYCPSPVLCHAAENQVGSSRDTPSLTLTHSRSNISSLDPCGLSTTCVGH